MNATDAPADVVEAVASFGRRIRGARLLSPPDPRKRGRSAWRVDLEDGASLKARCLESAAAARALVALREGLEPAFVPALAACGDVVLEPWIEGRPLEDGDDRAAEAGALLGRLHAVRRPGIPATVATARWRERAGAHLDEIAAAGVLDAREVDALRGQVARLDPGEARAALVHRDFCGENMVVDAAGRLHVVDNEWFDVDAAGLDVGRTLHRWPMDEPARHRFLDAYRASAPADPGPTGFWLLVAVLWSARARLERPGLAVPLAAARSLAAGGDPFHPPEPPGASRPRPVRETA